MKQPALHLPDGVVPAGKGVRAICTCGWRTSHRADEEKAFTALNNQHGYTDPKCTLCGRDSNIDVRRWRDDLEIITDSETGEQFLACRGAPRECRERSTQQQVHLDRAAADALGAELPTPTLRLVRDDVQPASRTASTTARGGRASKPTPTRGIVAVAVLPGATGEPDPAGERARVAFERYLSRCKLAENTVKAYRRQGRAYLAWLTEHAAAHPDAFADVVGAEGAVTTWRRHLLRRKTSPATVNQALAAVTLLYDHGARLRIQIKRAQVPRPGKPQALEPSEQGAVERAAARRGVRDAAIIAMLLHAGARVEECARLDVQDVAITARTGTVRLLGKGTESRDVPLPAVARDRISAWLRERGPEPGPLWTGQRGPMTISGITQVVLAVGEDAKIPTLRPHRLRHTYATRLRQSGADVAEIQALLGHAQLETTARYFRAGDAELAAAVEQAFDA